MIRVVLTFILLMLHTPSHLLSSPQTPYFQFDSIEELIQFETSSIEQAHSTEQRAEAYASRGESFLLHGDLPCAVEDFKASYVLADCIPNSEVSQMATFRALFGLALSYCNLDDIEMLLVTTDALRKLSDNLSYSNCSKMKSHINSETKKPLRSILRCNTNNVPIFGPDSISITDCVDFVNNTVAFSKLLICKASPAARGILTFAINQLGDQARRCCLTGGIWKGCVQKLVNKYHQWNQKWQMLGIPPDPSWD